MGGAFSARSRLIKLCTDDVKFPVGLFGSTPVAFSFVCVELVIGCNICVEIVVLVI